MTVPKKFVTDEPYYTPRDVLEEACAMLHIAYDPEDPKGSFNKVVCWNVKIALDPAVSEDAKALYEKGRADMLADLLDGKVKNDEAGSA